MLLLLLPLPESMPCALLRLPAELPQSMTPWPPPPPPPGGVEGAGREDEDEDEEAGTGSGRTAWGSARFGRGDRAPAGWRRVDGRSPKML